MALPTLSTNQPLAGSISWTAFSLTYDGITYPFVAGNTNKKFTWWQYNGGVSPALMVGDALPALTPDDLLLFLNKNGVGVLVPYTDVIEGSLIVSGSILADSIGANQIVTSHLAADSVKAAAIDANAIEAQHISSGAITTSKLSVGSIGDNMVANGSFEDATEGWTISQGNGVSDVVGGVSSSGANALRMVRNTANQGVKQLPAFYIPVSGLNGTKWYISCRAGAASALASGFYLRVHWLQADKVTVASTAFVDIKSNVALGTAWALFDGQATPPSNARYMAIEFINALTTSTMYVDEVSALEVVVSAQIADGAITAAKILAGTITADRIAAGVITADKMAIGDFSNVVSGGTFDDTNLMLNWTLASGHTRVTTAPQSGLGCLQLAAGAGTRTTTNKDIRSVSPDDQIYYEYYVKTSADWNGTPANSKVRFGNQANAYIAEMPFSLSTTWVAKSGKFTVPAGAYGLTTTIVSDNTVGTAWVDEVLVRRMSKGSLIVDGAITANHIVANAILADAIDANAITAKHTLTGAKLRTAASGQRVEIDVTGLKGYAADGTTVKTSVGTDGLLTATDAVITGTIKSADTGRRVEISSTSAKFYSPSDYYAAITAYNDEGASGSALSIESSSGVLWVSHKNMAGGGSSEVQLPITEAQALWTTHINDVEVMLSSNAFTFSGIYSGVAGNIPVAATRMGRVNLEGIVTSSAATFNANTQYTIGSIPVEFAPNKVKWFQCVWNSTGRAVVSIDTAGVVKFSLDQTITLGSGALRLSLDGPFWDTPAQIRFA